MGVGFGAAGRIPDMGELGRDPPGRPRQAHALDQIPWVTDHERLRPRRPTYRNRSIVQRPGRLAVQQLAELQQLGRLVDLGVDLGPVHPGQLRGELAVGIVEVAWLTRGRSLPARRWSLDALAYGLLGLGEPASCVGYGSPTGQRRRSGRYTGRAPRRRTWVHPERVSMRFVIAAEAQSLTGRRPRSNLGRFGPLRIEPQCRAGPLRSSAIDDLVLLAAD
jgi:hypothetical protein